LRRTVYEADMFRMRFSADADGAPLQGVHPFPGLPLHCLNVSSEPDHDPPRRTGSEPAYAVRST
jgi:hypothetical protein